MNSQMKTAGDTVHVSAEEIHSRLTAAFIRAGLSESASMDTADSLTEAECAGKSGHGLVRTEYVCSEAVSKNPGSVSIENEGVCFLGIDGNRHMGYHPGVIGIGKGLKIAEKSGICFVGIRNASHSGMLSFFARKIARKGYWGLVMAHCMPLMAPHGGGSSVFGTNPIALGVPRQDEEPLVIDVSFAATTFGAVNYAKSTGNSIKEGTALDREGRPSTDPEAVLQGGTVLPAAGCKGSALACMIQLICGPLVGASPIPERAADYGLSFLIISPGLFHDRMSTDAGVEKIISAVLTCPPMEGYEKVLFPGEQSARALELSLKNGLEVDKNLWEKAGILAGLPG